MNRLATTTNHLNHLPTEARLLDSGTSDAPTACGFSIPVIMADAGRGPKEAYTHIKPINGGTVSVSEDGLLLVTDSRQWACSAEAEIDLGDNRRSHTVIVELKVEEGQLGVGWIAPDRSRWVSRASTRAGDGVVKLQLRIPQEDTQGLVVFDNWTPRNKPTTALLRSVTVIDNARAHLNATEAYEEARSAESAGRLEEAVRLYSEALRQNPAHVLARARLGELRLRPPPQPFLDELRRRVQVDTAEVIIEIRNPCNYRCFYCVAAGRNNEPVQRLDLEAIEKAYGFLKQKCVVTSLECGGGEPTVHPQFPALVELISRYGAVSFPTNNSQAPEHWLPKATAHRLLIRSALHPESEEKLDRYLRNARYLIEHGCDFAGTFIAHPSRLEKIGEYRKFFQDAGVPFYPVAFIGDYQGKRYPHSYAEEEKRMIGIDQQAHYWLHQIEPHVTRIRNFRGIPCIAGFRSIYITKEGSLRRCMYDLERVLDKPLSKSEPCGVSNCGCGMLLDKMNSVDAFDFYNFFAKKIGLAQVDVSWMKPFAEQIGYAEPHEAIAAEMRAMYDALMEAYGKDELPEE
jgi:organic radical activating enzyme